MKKMLFLHTERCTGCLSCVTICSQRNEKMSAPSRARIHVDLKPFSGEYRPHLCLQCKDAPCAEACPVEAIQFNEELGYWDVDYKTCIGCKQCISACPLGVMFYDPIGEKVMKCHICQGDPACTRICPTQALIWGDAGDRANYLKRIL